LVSLERLPRRSAFSAPNAPISEVGDGKKGDLAMLGDIVCPFVAGANGGSAIMGLYSFILVVGICGLAAGITEGFRNGPMLRAAVMPPRWPQRSVCPTRHQSKPQW
jgi:hypothetical protein